MNMMQMMQQAQNIQKRIKEAQEELAQMEVTGESGGVVVTTDARGKFKSIKLKADNVDAETLELLEDLIAAAISDASVKAGTIMAEKMKAATGGNSTRCCLMI